MHEGEGAVTKSHKYTTVHGVGVGVGDVTEHNTVLQKQRTRGEALAMGEGQRGRGRGRGGVGGKEHTLQGTARQSMPGGRAGGIREWPMGLGKSLFQSPPSHGPALTPCPSPPYTHAPPSSAANILPVPDPHSTPR